jgi:parallel beta-helix repeat protein
MKRLPGAAACTAALALAWVLHATGAAAGSEPAALRGPVGADTVWEGRIAVGDMITVAAGATLTVRPGTEVRFSPQGGLTVLGALRAEGTAGQPVLFLPAVEGQEPWAGINLAGDATSVLALCRVAGARAVSLSAGAHRVTGCEISGGLVGIAAGGDKTRGVIAGNRLHDLREGGILCTAGAAPAVTDNVVERCGSRGIGANQGAAPEIRGNRVSGCESGIELNQCAPRVSGNTVTDCTRGIALTSVEGGEAIRGNRLERNEIGILCQQYADPEIAGNTIVNNGDGIVCFMGAAPLIRGNDILDNQRGVFCNQLSTPEITANTIAGNRVGVVLHLSSYALVRGNNITGGETRMQLMNMSSDWERRAGVKAPRGLQQRNRGLVERGRAMPVPGLKDGLELEGASVSASGNWWGEETTREMQQKGPDADIAGLIDYHDVPKRTYEGYEGEYLQDRITYAPWAKERIPATGVPAPDAAPGK